MIALPSVVGGIFQIVWVVHVERLHLHYVLPGGLSGTGLPSSFLQICWVNRPPAHML